MTMIAYAVLQHRRLAQAGRKKKNQRTSASAKLAGGAPSHRRSFFDRHHKNAHTAKDESVKSYAGVSPRAGKVANASGRP
jgi:hypothetical protein